MTAHDDRVVGRAIALALDAHAGQVTSDGARRIDRCLRVLTQVQVTGLTGQLATALRCAAVLHDTPTHAANPRLTREHISRGFDPLVLALLDTLAYRDGEAAEEYAARVAADPLAQRIADAKAQDATPRRASVDRGGGYRERRALELLEEAGTDEAEAIRMISDRFSLTETQAVALLRTARAASPLG